MVEKFGHRIVGDKEVEAAVAVIICEGNPQTLARKPKAGFLRNFGKVSLAVVVVHQWRNRMETIRMAVRPVAFFALAAPDIVKVPLQISKHD